MSDPGPADSGGQWVQDPGGGWHLIATRPSRRKRAIVAVLLVLGAAGGGLWWSHQDQVRQQEQEQRHACELIGGLPC